MITNVACEAKSLDQELGSVPQELEERLRRNEEHLKRGGKAPRIWHINSTATGGGVAEMLPNLVGYVQGLGFDCRWLVIAGDDEFFAITKRIHNGLHASAGDGGALGPRESEHYEGVMRRNAEALQQYVSAGDLVVLHDPQTIGLAPWMRKAGARVIWRCHIGYDKDNEYVSRSWNFLQPYSSYCEHFIFTRMEYAPSYLDSDDITVIPPAIDAHDPKNQELPQEDVAAILAHIGMVQAPQFPLRSVTFRRRYGGTGRLKRYADLVHAGPLPRLEDPMVVQVSRWDRLKDMLGVMLGFADHVINHDHYYLALVGPSVRAVADDPEGIAAYRECVTSWRALPHFKRQRIQLCCLPMHDAEENAVIVNAIQRHATVVVQKSLYEGFGLTVSEAMWKSKAVVGSAVGGIKEQIKHNVNGLLVTDPTDLQNFGCEVKRLLQDAALRQSLAKEAHESVRRDFLIPRQICQYLEVFRRLMDSQAKGLAAASKKY